MTMMPNQGEDLDCYDTTVAFTFFDWISFGTCCFLAFLYSASDQVSSLRASFSIFSSRWKKAEHWWPDISIKAMSETS
jgi:hypothetical protein